MYPPMYPPMYPSMHPPMYPLFVDRWTPGSGAPPLLCRLAPGRRAEMAAAACTSRLIAVPSSFSFAFNWGSADGHGILMGSTIPRACRALSESPAAAGPAGPPRGGASPLKRGRIVGTLPAKVGTYQKFWKLGSFWHRISRHFEAFPVPVLRFPESWNVPVSETNRGAIPTRTAREGLQ